MDKKKILLIEDDALTRELYQEILEQEGYELIIASDGAQGYELAAKGGFDLILLDIMMPKMDGVTLLTKLKEAPPPIKNGNILLLTNLEHDTVIKQALDLGAAGYLIKSNLTPGQVLDKLKTYLSSSGQSQAQISTPVKSTTQQPSTVPSVNQTLTSEPQK